MQSNSSSRTVDEIVAGIAALDLEPIKVKLMDPDEGQGWTREHAERIETAYRRYLTLLAKYPGETFAPSRDVDKFWHGHILDTMKYAEDCERVFGYFLHHFPYFGMRGEADAQALAQASRTMSRLYEAEYGEAMPARPSMRPTASKPLMRPTASSRRTRRTASGHRKRRRTRHTASDRQPLLRIASRAHRRPTPQIDRACRPPRHGGKIRRGPGAHASRAGSPGAGYACRRPAMAPQIKRTTMAPTTAPMSPAPSPGEYQPSACPR